MEETIMSGRKAMSRSGTMQNDSKFAITLNLILKHQQSNLVPPVVGFRKYFNTAL